MKLFYLIFALALPFLGFGQQTQCEIDYSGNNFENAEFGLHVKYIANDFDIAEGTTMTIEKIIPTIVNNIATADIFIYEDNNGQPGNIVTTFNNVVPSSQTQVSSNFNLPWYEVELDFPTPLTLVGATGGSKYWVGLIVAFGTDASSNFWEVKSNGSTDVMHTSLDQGVTWTPSSSGFDGVFQLIGVCEAAVATEPCEIVEGGNNFENAELGLTYKYIANDFDIEEGAIIQVSKIIPNIVYNIDVADIFIYEDNNGQPGTLVTSYTDVTPLSQTEVSTKYGYSWYEVELELPSPVSLEGQAGGSKYWIGLTTTMGTDNQANNYWEIKSTGTTAAIHSSTDQGATWSPNPSGADGVFKILGACNVVVDPPEPCEIVEEGNNFENAELGLNDKYMANDFDIAEGASIEISKIIPNIVYNIDVADIFIYEDNNGKPGNLITSFDDVVPTSQTIVSNNFNYPWYEVELDLPTTVTLEGAAGGSKFWLGLFVTMGTDNVGFNFWEIKSNGTTAPTHLSVDEGVTWTPNVSGSDGVFQIIGNCSGDITIVDEYCEVAVNSQVTPITNVSFADIQNTTSADITAPAHEYYLNFEGNVTQNNEYEISLEGNTNGDFSDYYTAFIDWNQNGILDDVGEVYEIGTITNSTGSDGQVLTGTISVPFHAITGNTRVRINKVQGAYSLDPCASIEIGQIEDYTLVVHEFQDTYCEVPVSITVEPITKVLFAGIDNTTSADISSPAHEYFLNMEGNVEQGFAYTLTVEGNTNGTESQYFTAFIDWNQNGVLDDAGEIYEIGTITNSTGEDGQQAIRTIDVPFEAPIGITRVRIIKWHLDYPIDPCLAIAFGQAEDYVLNVSEYENPYCEISISDTVTPITNVTFAGIANLSSAATTSSAQEMFIEIDGTVEQGNEYIIKLEGFTNGDTTNYYTAFFDWNQNGVLDDAGEVYELGTITNSTGTDGVELVKRIQVDTDALLGETRMKLIASANDYPLAPCGEYTFGQSEDYTINVFEYCLPDISLKAPTTRVIFADIDNSSPSDPFTAPAYESFLDIEANVLTGETYDITVQGNPIWDLCFAAFIDWNQNGILDDAGEVYQIDCVDSIPGGDEGQLAFGTIEVPETAVVGTTRMRIISRADGAPLEACGTYYYGQAEDYTVIVRNTPLPVCEIACPEDITAEIPMGQTSTAIDYEVSFSCDNSDGVVLELVEGLPSGSEFPVGVTNVVYNLEHEGEVINTCEFTITVEGVLITDSFNENAFAIYPNPANNNLNIISYNSPITRAIVYDIRGRKILEKQLNKQNNGIIDVSKLDSALYFVSIYTADGFVTKRFLRE
ncbi:GEVED domain-containing protein [uncultured Marixanthomonas sp.]|uniref:GEVED domain-containing protein n=1 Tax=uncultured Marixanthomonas sp. TaxID=757245 RepID=UPI0030D9A9A5